MIKDITVIITLYKTPLNKLKNLKNYKFFKLIIFEQHGSEFSKKQIEKLLGNNFEYYFSKNNIGLPKASNFLIKKIKTKFFLFTQADIIIKKLDILKLAEVFKINKNIIFATPNISKKKIKIKKFPKLKFQNSVDASCMLCETKKVKKINFFDEDFFLYWEDIDLFQRVNHSRYKMVKLNNIFAKHDASHSSANNLKTSFLRISNYTYGELLYDYKNKKLRIIKIFRKISQKIIMSLFLLFSLKPKKSLLEFFQLIGVIKFIFFIFKKK